MNKYYILECYTPHNWEDSALLEGIRLPDPFESLTRGQKLKKPPKEPVEIEMDENHCDRLLEFDNTDGLFMTKRLYQAFREAGVDNMEVYQTVVHHPRTGFSTTDYLLINLIGLVKAADLSQSKVIGGSKGFLLDTDFEGVEIDSGQAHELLMFRLAESTNAVVVHESVKNHLIQKGFSMLDFVEPSDWIG